MNEHDSIEKKKTRAMMWASRLDKYFWTEAVNTAWYVVNQAPSTIIELKTSMEMWTCKPANYSNLHIFGSHVYAMYNAKKLHNWFQNPRNVYFLDMLMS